ncbi:MAG TPA: TonB-dependent receptor [Candidatus Sulfopaludibacter sp.]|nr:TonB-dependent receptor [Candidatus Sulfopaludibacter sp.]
MNWKAAASLFVFLSVPVFAQSAAGMAGISGVVRDASGAVVPNAKVVIASQSQGTLRTLVTNGEGVFAAPALPPGSGYSVNVTAAGFATYEAAGLVLLVGQNLDLRVALTVGQAATKVEVTAAAPLVEDTKTQLSQVVDNRDIQDLPINGRRVDSFALLTPGVSNDYYYGLLSFRGVAGQNAFLVDGTDTTEQFYNENAGRTRIASQISADAVQEFQVVSSNYSAEYGRAMGGIVNTVTKSGGNQFHGTAFWFYRSTGFDARDPFASFNPSEKRQQAGGTIGGPIKKDKLFFFLSTEITRRNFPMADSLNTVAVSPTTQTWNLCGVASGSTPAATPAQCAAINKLLPRFYGVIPREMNQELYLGKLDYHVSDRNTLSAQFNFLHEVSPNGIQTGASSTFGGALNSNGDDSVTLRNGHASWTFVPSSSFVNDLRFGLATDRQADTFDQSELGQGLGYLQVSVNGTTLGPANYLPRVEPMETRYQFQDNATWTKGTHTVKFGFDVATTEDYAYFTQNHFGGYTYQTVNAFALDYSGSTTGAKNWQSYVQSFGNPVADFRINDLGFYVQDQWRATDRLTLMLGLRYEHAQLPQPPVCNHDYPGTCQTPSQTKDFAPRLGLTYRLNDKTVLQAGYGIFFARFQGATFDNLFTTGNGITQPSIFLGATQPAQLAAGPVFPNALAAVPGTGVGSTGLQYLAPNLKTPYSEQGNIGIQRQITSDLAIDVSYLWSRGVQLYGIRDLNLPTTTTNFTYAINDVNGSPAGSYTTPVVVGARPDPRYGAIYYDENGVNSYYSALAVQVNKAFSHGLQGLFSYTWSHEIDDGQSFGESTNSLFLSNSFYWLNNGDYKADKGSGNLDQRHRAALSWIWAPTITRRTDAFSKYVVNGWQLSSITSLASGHPAGNITVNLTDKPVPGMFSNFSLNGTGFSGRAPWLPVNGYYLPPYYRSDARISKILPIAEKYQLYLNFEVFNLTNSWAATGYTSSQGYTEAKGVITPTPTRLYVPGGDLWWPDGTQARRLQISARLVF